MGRVKTGLGIWAFGAMGTRFVPGGYQPQWAGESTAGKVARAVEGLGDPIDGAQYEKDAVAAYELVYAALGA